MSDDSLNPVRVKYIVTSAIYTTNMLLGMLCYLIGPSRFDVADLVHSDLQGVSNGHMMRAVGVAIGSAMSPVLFKGITRQTAQITSVMVAALSMLAIPFARQLYQYLMTELFLGFTNGINGSNKNSWILEMWTSSANPYMQGVHAVYAVGTVISPLVVAPFLADRNSSGVSDNQTRIIIPITVLSGSTIITCVVITVIYLRFPYHDSKRSVQKEKHELVVIGQCSSVKYKYFNKYYNMILITLGGLLICCYTGIELSTSGFSATFVSCIPLSFTPADAAHVESAYSSAFAINRIISIYVATKISARTMLLTSFSTLFLGNSLLLFFADNSVLMVWIAFVMIGAGHSCVTPCIMCFIEERINVTTTVCSFFILCSCLTSMVIPVILGRYLKSHPLVYVYVNLFGLLICVIVYCVVQFLDRLHNKSSQ